MDPYTISLEITKEIAISRESGELTPRALEIFEKITEKFAELYPVTNSEECKAAAIAAIKLHWEKLPASKPSITLNYYSNILKSGYISKLKKS